MTFQDQSTQQPPPDPQSGVVDTGSGFLVGVDPAQPRQAADWGNGQNGNGQQMQPPLQQPQERVFTAAEVEAFRQQEKDKLYPQMQEMSQQLRELTEARQAELAERQAAIDAAEAARKEKEESEMDLRALIDKRDQEWQQRLEAIEQQSAAERAIFERERTLSQLNDYMRDRIEQESQYIDPNLRDFVTGSTPEEVDASIEFIKQRSAAIAANYAAVMGEQQAMQPFRGAAMPSVPPVGPMEQLPSYEQITPEMIDGMTMDEYKRHRPALLQAASRAQKRQGR